MPCRCDGAHDSDAGWKAPVNADHRPFAARRPDGMVLAEDGFALFDQVAKRSTEFGIVLLVDAESAGKRFRLDRLIVFTCKCGQNQFLEIDHNIAAQTFKGGPNPGNLKPTRSLVYPKIVSEPRSDDSRNAESLTQRSGAQSRSAKSFASRLTD